MEDPVGYDGGNPTRQSAADLDRAIETITRQPPAPDDHFEHAAQATLSQWSELRRSLARANEVIDELRAENAEANARIGELERANGQLSANLDESLRREGEAKEQAGYLKGIMTTAASALMEGMGRQTTPLSSEARDAVRRLSRLDRQ